MSGHNIHIRKIASYYQSTLTLLQSGFDAVRFVFSQFKKKET